MIGQLEDQTVIKGNDLIFEIEIMGNPMPAVQWLKGESEIMMGDKYCLSFLNKKATITIKDTTIEDSGNYKIVVTNLMGSASSNANAKILGKLPHFLICHTQGKRF